MENPKSQYVSLLDGFDKSDLLKWALTEEKIDKEITVDGSSIKLEHDNIRGINVGTVIVLVEVDDRTTIRLRADDFTGNRVTAEVVRINW